MIRRMFAALLLGALTLEAADQTWKLTDGREVAVLKVLSQSATHVTVRSADGIVQIDKRQLPEELRGLYPFDEAAAAAERDRAAEERARVATADRAPEPRLRPPPPGAAQPNGGVSIVSMRPVARATAYVTLTNRSEQMVEVHRDLFVGVNLNGAAFPTSRLTNPRGDILTRIRIPAGATTEIGIVFDIPEGDVGDIGGVFWRK